MNVDAVLRWFPAVLLLFTLGGTLFWMGFQPIADVKASVLGFLAVAGLCVLLVPALLMAIEE